MTHQSPYQSISSVLHHVINCLLNQSSINQIMLRCHKVITRIDARQAARFSASLYAHIAQSGESSSIGKRFLAWEGQLDGSK